MVISNMQHHITITSGGGPALTKLVVYTNQEENAFNATATSKNTKIFYVAMDIITHIYIHRPYI